MSALLTGLAFSLLTALVVIAGDLMLKVAADTGKPVLSMLVLSGCAIYAISALFWLYAMRHITLGQAAVTYSMLTLLALCFVGVFWFGERLELREIGGICCAIAAMVLMVRVT